MSLPGCCEDQRRTRDGRAQNERLVLHVGEPNASYYRDLYLPLKGGVESSQLQDHAQSPIYLSTVTQRKRHTWTIHNQKINTTSVSKPEVLFIFLFACLGPPRATILLLLFPVHVHAFLLSRAALHLRTSAQLGVGSQRNSQCVAGAPLSSPYQRRTLPTVPSPGSTTHRPGPHSSISSRLERRAEGPDHGS